MATRTKSALETLQELFVRRWRCEVLSSGFHNGATCNPNEPHQGWDCEYKWMAPALDDTQATRKLLDVGEE